jgi:hypothetical protein
MDTDSGVYISSMMGIDRGFYVASVVAWTEGYMEKVDCVASIMGMHREVCVCVHIYIYIHIYIYSQYYGQGKRGDILEVTVSPSASRGPA